MELYNYKLPVKVSKAKGTLELFNSMRFLSLMDRLDFPLVHLVSNVTSFMKVWNTAGEIDRPYSITQYS